MRRVRRPEGGFGVDPVHLVRRLDGTRRIGHTHSRHRTEGFRCHHSYAWEEHFRELGVEFTPIRGAEFGYHLNFRDPDGIALELAVSKTDSKWRWSWSSRVR
jgi:catechol 2,3-dioxygenase-like lactoylglutathione lyase family enzyme